MAVANGSLTARILFLFPLSLLSPREFQRTHRRVCFFLSFIVYSHFSSLRHLLPSLFHLVYLTSRLPRLFASFSAGLYIFPHFSRTCRSYNSFSVFLQLYQFLLPRRVAERRCFSSISLKLFCLSVVISAVSLCDSVLSLQRRINKWNNRSTNLT